MLLTFCASGLAPSPVGAAVSQNSAAIHDHLQKAAEYLKANDSGSAIREFRAVLALDPGNAEANANVGVAVFFQKDYKTAAQYLSKALTTDPSLTKTQALLGLCQLRLGQPSAQTLLERAFAALKEKPLKIQVGLELAGIYNQRGDLDRTVSVMQSLVDLDPDNVDILYKAQRAYADLSDDTLNKLAIIAPGSARMQQVIAQRLINSGDLNGAVAHYRKALELDSHLSGVHYELAEAILESSPSDPATQAESEKELDLAVKLDGSSPRTECVFARIAARRSDPDGAFAHYSRALAMNPGETEAQIGVGRQLAATGKPREAAEYFRKAIESDPLNGEAHYRLALACKKLDLPDEAASELRLFQEIKQTKKDLKELYRQMNKRPHTTEQEAADIP